MPATQEEIFIPSISLFFAIIGLVLSVSANFFCGYATTNNVTFTEQVDALNITTDLSSSWRAGIWNYESYDLYYIMSREKIILVKFYFCVPWNGQTKVDKDTNWKAAQAFTIISVVLGGIVVLASCCNMCSDMKVSRKYANHLGATYLLIVLCQGLTFLYFSSNACNQGSAESTHGNQDFQIEWDGCSISTGARCSIASIVFYFVAGLILFFAAIESNKLNNSNNNEDGCESDSAWPVVSDGHVSETSNKGSDGKEETKQQEQ